MMMPLDYEGSFDKADLEPFWGAVAGAYSRMKAEGRKKQDKEKKKGKEMLIHHGPGLKSNDIVRG